MQVKLPAYMNMFEEGFIFVLTWKNQCLFFFWLLCYQ